MQNHEELSRNWMGSVGSSESSRWLRSPI
ncbi:hypothetical protein WG66_003389 [Moniliophthora roreri]|nr:hypothetical protein WG66_003389 [Moniliophthora roreri]